MKLVLGMKTVSINLSKVLVTKLMKDLNYKWGV